MFMSKTTPFLRGLLALALLALLFPTGGAAPALGQGKTIRIALNEDPDILDPSLARSYVGRIIFANTCEKLYDIDAKGDLIPQLAASLPKFTNGGKTVEIKLRSGLKFNDGTVADAQALKLSLERHQTIKGSARKSEIASVVGIDVVDAHTIRLQMTAPFSPIVAALADRAGMMMSPAAVEKLGDRFGTAPVCVGPWKFVERVPQERIVLERSPYYDHPRDVKIDRLIFRIIPDDSVRLANLRSGDIDVMHLVPPTDVKAIRQDANLTISEVPGPGYQGLTINFANKTGRTQPPQSLGTPLATSAKVREAFELSIDRDALNQVVFDGLYDPGCTPVPAPGVFHVKEIQCPKRDVAKAKLLLAEAGYPNGVKFEMMLTNNPQQNRVGQVIQGMAGDAGFQIALRPAEFASALQQQDNGQFEVFLIGWSGRPDPDGNIHGFHTCKGSFNYTHACDPEIDALLNKAREVSDTGERYKLYADATQRFLARRNLVYLYHLKYIVAMNKKVQGYVATPDGLIRMSNVGMR
jgi:peptide/nickel transport system substrate-binding protein